jgi:hypothetical protein
MYFVWDHAGKMMVVVWNTTLDPDYLGEILFLIEPLEAHEAKS